MWTIPLSSSRSANTLACFPKRPRNDCAVTCSRHPDSTQASSLSSRFCSSMLRSGWVMIAADVDADCAIHSLPQFLDLAGYDLRLEFEFKISVRTGHDIGSAAFRGHPQHFDRLFEGLRAIIHARQDVAVDIDKIQINISSSCVA